MGFGVPSRQLRWPAAAAAADRRGSLWRREANTDRHQLWAHSEPAGPVLRRPGLGDVAPHGCDTERQGGGGERKGRLQALCPIIWDEQAPPVTEMCIIGWLKRDQ